MNKLLLRIVLLGIALPIALAAHVESRVLTCRPSQPGDSAPLVADTPSRHSGALLLDHTRRLLTCDSGRCRWKLIRSQQEMLDAMNGAPVERNWPRARTRKAAVSEAREPATDAFAVRLMIGSCFGADLPSEVERSVPRPGARAQVSSWASPMRRPSGPRM